MFKDRPFVKYRTNLILVKIAKRFEKNKRDKLYHNFTCPMELGLF